MFVSLCKASKSRHIAREDRRYHRKRSIARKLRLQRRLALRELAAE